MSASWRELRLGEVIELKRGYDLPNQARRSGAVPVVSSSGPSGFHDEPKVRAPGVVTGRYGTLGEIFYVAQDYWPLNTTLYVRDFKGNDPRFISYFLRSVDLLSCSDKAAVPGLNRNHLHELTVRVPPASEQRAIARILGALDDKIELNRRTNETLEAMARAIFQSWFVDFDPVRAKMEGRQPEGMDAETAKLFPSTLDANGVPVGWSLRSLHECADWINGAAYRDFDFCEPGQGMPIIKIAELKAGVTAQTRFTLSNPGERYRIDTGDVLFSWSGNPDTSIDTFIWARGPAWLNQHIFKVVPAAAAQRAFLISLLRYLKPEFADIARNKQTTGLGHVTAGDMKRLMISWPSPGVMSAWDRVASPIIAKVEDTLRSNITLEMTRDSLLPRLLSGELRVPDAERAVADAL